MNWQTAVATVLGLVGLASGADAGWTESKVQDRSLVTFVGQTESAGGQVPFSIAFGSDPVVTADSTGTIGFDLSMDAKDFAGFPFADFEGPDAATAPRIKVEAETSGGEAKTFEFDASGSFADENQFVFSVAEVCTDRKCPERALLETLAGKGVTQIRLEVTDPRPGGQTLEFRIPIGENVADFQTLLRGLP